MDASPRTRRIVREGRLAAQLGLDRGVHPCIVSHQPERASGEGLGYSQPQAAHRVVKKQRSQARHTSGLHSPVFESRLRRSRPDKAVSGETRDSTVPGPAAEPDHMTTIEVNLKLVQDEQGESVAISRTDPVGLAESPEPDGRSRVSRAAPVARHHSVGSTGRRRSEDAHDNEGESSRHTSPAQSDRLSSPLSLSPPPASEVGSASPTYFSGGTAEAAANTSRPENLHSSRASLISSPPEESSVGAVVGTGTMAPRTRSASLLSDSQRDHVGVGASQAPREQDGNGKARPSSSKRRGPASAAMDAGEAPAMNISKDDVTETASLQAPLVEEASGNAPSTQMPDRNMSVPPSLIPQGVARLAAAALQVQSSFESTSSAVSDKSSLPSGPSSKATTPIDHDGSRNQAETSTGQPGLWSGERKKWNIQPKSSIPRGVAPQVYAQECIEAAESSRLNPYALHPQEYKLLGGHITPGQVTTYLNIRNGICRLWLRKPIKAVTREDAVGLAGARWFDAASVCFDWLIREGYINHGCLMFQKASLGQSGQTMRRRTVVVVGAGMSGLSTARHLEHLIAQYATRFGEMDEQPPKVVVLEGRGRIGGRVYSRPFSATGDPGFVGQRRTAEMGGMIITGFLRGNPLNVLVRGQLGLPYHRLEADAIIYDSNGGAVHVEDDLLAENLFNDCLERLSKYKFKPQRAKLIEGNRTLIDDGKNGNNDGGKTIFQIEQAKAALPQEPPASQQNVVQPENLVAVAADKLTGRAVTLPEDPAIVKAYEKMKSMGFPLKSSARADDNVVMDHAAQQPGATLGSVFDDGISQYRKFVDLTPQHYRLINWHIANLEYSFAQSLHGLSLEGWDMDAGNEWEGQHSMIIGGYQSVLRGVMQCPFPLDVRINSPVKQIKYAPGGIGSQAAVTCDDGTVVEADAVVSTIPLGVLKAGSVQFDPPLPPWKTGAISRMGFGVLNKVVLAYENVFWHEDRHIFGVLCTPQPARGAQQSDYSSRRGRFFQWFNVTKTSGFPCLIALMAGEAGFDTERSTNEELIAEATGVLRNVFGPGVPKPVEAIVTRWGSDRFARGSYSSAGPGMHEHDYDDLGRSVGNLFFAGEHTSGAYPATVHGAYLAGLRAASEVIEAMIGPIHVPIPLVIPTDAASAVEAKEARDAAKDGSSDTYEAQMWQHIQSRIGDPPLAPAKRPDSAFILFRRAKQDVAKQKSGGNRKPGRGRNGLTEVLARMWKEASDEEKAPFMAQADEVKRQHDTLTDQYRVSAAKWDKEFDELRQAYIKEHPRGVEPGEMGNMDRSDAKGRRGKPVSYAEDDSSDMDD